ncbi:MAG: AAA family ATPase, partial [Bryobacterales bacterium]|nr:AAA family ATPase [Bryobacterales bacterium]
MINSLRLVDFKNFKDETLRVGPFTVIVGTNASGKSNIRDAFRFLHGIGRGYTLAEIVGGKYGPGGQIEWEEIRGTGREIIRFDQPAFGLELGLTVADQTATYSVEVSPEIGGRAGFRITYERLRRGPSTVFEKPRSRYGDQEVHLECGGSIDIAL